ncbi:MAG: nucleoside triphosphate pyrophosphohydrolase [Ectothiorhodospiraceae bacterium]|nr:nucleoside triphosphate pyrophosphohydrolase [Ectothiorhodospiraceae bacterium]
MTRPRTADSSFTRFTETTLSKIDSLIALMARLRDPDGGCPWDLEQTFATIAPYTVEEAYEVADAIARGDSGALRDELGDLLFQVVFHARMAEEAGWFAFDDVVEAIVDKMTRRHPHVFGAAERVDAAAQSVAWETIKAAERRTVDDDPSHLAGVAAGLAPLLRARKLQARAARVGFDWSHATAVLPKVREEVAELESAMHDADQAAVEGELGDVLFACVNLARHLEVDPETALAGASRKFERRFRAMERIARTRGIDLGSMGPDELEALWATAKAEEGGATSP